MGYKKDDPCIQKAFDDERLFVLMTRDNTAPEAGKKVTIPSIVFKDKNGDIVTPDKKIVMAYVVSHESKVLQIIRGDSEIIVEPAEDITWEPVY